VPHKLVVQGGVKLNGRVKISGAKNACLPMMAASLLAKGRTVLHNVPNLSDVRLMCEILEELGAKTKYENNTVEIDVQDESITVAPYELVSEMRASFCVLGPMLARRGHAEVAMPGGCVLGVRPVDLHIKGFRALGAKVDVEQGYVRADGSTLQGGHVFLGGPMGPSVTGTCNVLTTAVLTPGVTIIEEAACEPEVQALVEMLNQMGAKIQGGGTPRLVIEGVSELRPTEISVVPDRIEAGTFVLAAAITEGDITLEGVRPDHLGALIDKLRSTGVKFEINGPDSLRVIGPKEPLSVDITTLPYPGFPTDLQSPTMAYLMKAKGLSVVTEKIYPDRFMHIPEYNRLGGTVRKEGNMAIVYGVERLSGCPVKATDLRAGAGLVLAGLAADHTTEVFDLYHVDRGYDNFEGKLAALGAKIERVEFLPRRRAADRSGDAGMRRAA